MMLKLPDFLHNRSEFIRAPATGNYKSQREIINQTFWLIVLLPPPQRA
jgi:hypothetical protein